MSADRIAAALLFCRSISCRSISCRSISCWSISSRPISGWPLSDSRLFRPSGSGQGPPCPSSDRMVGMLASAVVMDSLRTTSTDLKPRNSVVAAITEVPTMPTKAAAIITPGLTIISTGPLRVRNRNRVSCVSQCRRRTNMGRSGLSLRSIGGVTRCNSRLRTEGMS